MHCRFQPHLCRVRGKWCSLSERLAAEAAAVAVAIATAALLQHRTLIPAF